MGSSEEASSTLTATSTPRSGSRPRKTFPKDPSPRAFAPASSFSFASNARRRRAASSFRRSLATLRRFTSAAHTSAPLFPRSSSARVALSRSRSRSTSSSALAIRSATSGGSRGRPPRERPRGEVDMSLRQWSLTWLRRRRARREPTSTEPASEACHSDQSSPAPSAPANAPGEAAGRRTPPTSARRRERGRGRGGGRGGRGRGGGGRGPGRRAGAGDAEARATRHGARARRRRRAREARHRERAETRVLPGNTGAAVGTYSEVRTRDDGRRTTFGFAGRRDPISPRKAPDDDEEDISSRHHNDAARDVGFAPAALAGRVASRRRPRSRGFRTGARSRRAVSARAAARPRSRPRRFA